MVKTKVDMIVILIMMILGHSLIFFGSLATAVIITIHLHTGCLESQNSFLRLQQAALAAILLF